MIRFLFAAAPVLILGAATTSAAVAAPHVSGRWYTEGNKAIVEIGACGTHVCGRIVKVLKPKPGASPNDVKNPDPALRSRPIEGIVILSGFTADDDKWKGRVYDPVTGRSYRSELARDGAILKVKGCLGPFCQTQSWARAS